MEKLAFDLMAGCRSSKATCIPEFSDENGLWALFSLNEPETTFCVWMLYLRAKVALLHTFHNSERNTLVLCVR